MTITRAIRVIYGPRTVPAAEVQADGSGAPLLSSIRDDSVSTYGRSELNLFAADSQGTLATAFLAPDFFAALSDFIKETQEAFGQKKKMWNEESAEAVKRCLQEMLGSNDLRTDSKVNKQEPIVSFDAQGNVVINLPEMEEVHVNKVVTRITECLSSAGLLKVRVLQERTELRVSFFMGDAAVLVGLALVTLAIVCVVTGLYVAPSLMALLPVHPYVIFMSTAGVFGLGAMFVIIKHAVMTGKALKHGASYSKDAVDFYKHAKDQFNGAYGFNKLKPIEARKDRKGRNRALDLKYGNLHTLLPFIDVKESTDEDSERMNHKQNVQLFEMGKVLLFLAAVQTGIEGKAIRQMEPEAPKATGLLNLLWRSAP